MKSTPFLLGLTGSIGMGKSTTARMFAEEGIPVWDADAVVDRLYKGDGQVVEIVSAICPNAVPKGKRSIDRYILREAASNNPSVLKSLEQAIHPLVASDRLSFIKAASQVENDIVLLDIPLLFETGQENTLDAVAVVTVPPDIQRSRVLARGKLTEEQFMVLLARQKPDEEKCMLADFVISTATVDGARSRVKEVLTEINREQKEK